MSSYLSVLIAGTVGFTTGEHFSTSRSIGSSSSAWKMSWHEDWLLGPCLDAPQQPTGLVSSDPKQNPGAQGRIWAHQTDTPFKEQKWMIHPINISVTFWLTAECPECRKLTAKSLCCSHICGELMLRDTAITHSLRVYFWPGQPTRQRLVLEADLSHPKYLLGSCCSPTCVGEPCSCSAILGSTHGIGSQWDWETPALSHPTLVAVSSRVREKNQNSHIVFF